jgi:hypothetical protein
MGNPRRLQEGLIRESTGNLYLQTANPERKMVLRPVARVVAAQGLLPSA